MTCSDALATPIITPKHRPAITQALAPEARIETIGRCEPRICSTKTGVNTHERRGKRPMHEVNEILGPAQRREQQSGRGEREGKCKSKQM